MHYILPKVGEKIWVLYEMGLIGSEFKGGNFF
jgi:hypothetical protein